MKTCRGIVRWILPALVVLITSLTSAVTGAQPDTGGRTVLRDGYPWRRTYRFRKNRYDPDVLRREGESILGRARFDRLRRDTEQSLRDAGIAPETVDWTEHVYHDLRGARALNPSPTPPPPADWCELDFDDSDWVRDSSFFQGGTTPHLTSPILGQYPETVDLRLQAAYYRARLTVNGLPEDAVLRVDIEYAGGVRLFVNGREVARNHLPDKALADDTPATSYPAEAYAPGDKRPGRRVLRDVAVPADCLRRGTNLIAVEVRAADFHPTVMTQPIQPNWGGPQRPWPHARLYSVRVRADGRDVASTLSPTPGFRVWAGDIHSGMLSSDYPAPGEETGALSIVATRNGTFSACLLAGADTDVLDLAVRVGDLGNDARDGRIDGGTFRVLYPAPYPTAAWTLEALGDERGLGASFPGRADLSRYESMAEEGSPYLFDALHEVAPRRIPGGMCRPVWLSVHIPRDAVPGTYSGTVTVSARGREALSVPLRLEVLDWLLPDAVDFRTLVGVEQNPYGVARHYGVQPWSDEHFALVEASLRQLGRIGNSWVNVPVLIRTEFGNGDDSMIRWIRRPDDSLTFDCTVLDRYLDLVLRHCGKPRVLQFVVMQGMPSPTEPPTPPQVMVFDEARGVARPYAVGKAKGQPRPQNDPAFRAPAPSGEAPAGTLPPKAWELFAGRLRAHLEKRGLADSMVWGAPLEAESDPDLKTVLAGAAPEVFWTAGGHEIMANATYCRDTRFYRVITDIRWQGGWDRFRDDMGWKSPIVHLANPRVGGTSFALHTTSLPFAYRTMVERALSTGRTGFTRVGADEWDGIHYRGMDVPRWLTGMPVLFVLWPGDRGAIPGIRFEMLLEGIQETEARIFLEQALDGGRLPGDVAARAREILSRRSRETDFFQANSLIRSMEAYHYGWQDRSRVLYATAAEVQSVLGR